VGEILSCLDFLRRLRVEFPRTGIFVSTSTLAGHATAEDRLKNLVDGVFFAPVDYVFVVRRILRRLRPSILVIAETEIWPNLFREVKRTGAALTIVNARISGKAFHRYRNFRWLFAAIMPALDSVLAQSEDIRQRWITLGVPTGRVRETGNFKYDFEAAALSPESPVNRWLQRCHQLHSPHRSPVWIAASTTPAAQAGDPDEDDVVIAAYLKLTLSHPRLLLILAPRKPERFAVVAAKLEAAGVPFARRSNLDASGATAPRVLLLDSIGELSALFAAADVVFMGGTLVHRGGHNILEPALHGKPVIAGPHMENFQAIADDFQSHGAYVTIETPSALAVAVDRLLAAPEEAQELGRRAKACAEARRGASAQAVDEVRQLRRVPAYHPALPWYAVLWLLARVWEWGSRRRRRNDLLRLRRLPVAVISVGNLTMGGTGKTPCVLRLAELLKERGRKPAILTRGYGRQSPDRCALAGPGADMPAHHSGDEAQIFIRSGVAPVGIGADRFQSGTLLLRDYVPDVVLLDDGFQHWKLARDVDIVLIDALEPFGGGDVFPLGRLREPLSALARASLILITRCEGSDLARPITREVRRWHPNVPVFQAGVQPLAWVKQDTGERFGIDERPFGVAGAFCGLGNPATFRRTLDAMGVEVVDWIEFDDHHRYRPRELQNVAAQMTARGATALVTTEKDAINLCESPRELVAPLPLYWLQIGIKIEREDEFLSAAMSLLNP
jgi:tetraacyldisaccharide 4'-kinase